MIAPTQHVLWPSGELQSLGGTMESYARDSGLLEIPEQRLWLAVITSTVEEWIHGPLRKQREAELFLFSNH
jgi:hypothetical protein